MVRIAFAMQLRAGCKIEYKRRHDEIWPELMTLIRQAGIYDYSIFLDEESLKLFAVQKRRDGHTAGRLHEEKIMRKWWEYMADILEVNPDGSPVISLLREVFHME